MCFMTQAVSGPMIIAPRNMGALLPSPMNSGSLVAMMTPITENPPTTPPLWTASRRRSAAAAPTGPGARLFLKVARILPGIHLRRQLHQAHFVDVYLNRNLGAVDLFRGEARLVRLVLAEDHRGEHDRVLGLPARDQYAVLDPLVHLVADAEHAVLRRRAHRWLWKASRLPKKTAELLDRLEQWRSRIQGPVPTRANPDFDAADEAAAIQAAGRAAEKGKAKRRKK